ncbi:type II secretion system protein M [Sphingobium sufflavum]|uniref:type II secretion system protein GspM n=1 Tax=Sphingobium sufflavum TaxID=1129547 RepID=UPI001F201D08|nr:type II secretion system protein GspM [Sphingobium sufflavum]MCE7797497.1 type II secretion system protein M [Sphingobium sufflavum]
MTALKQWWSGLSGRERRLVTIMLLLVGGLVLWLGVWRPVEAGIASGWARYGAAVDANASVRARLRLIRRASGTGVVAPIGQSVAQTASEAGLTLDRSAAQGAGQMAVTIASARASAALAWLAGLEARGIIVETISMTPGATPGTVAVQAVLREVK